MMPFRVRRTGIYAQSSEKVASPPAAPVDDFPRQKFPPNARVV